MQTSAFPPAPSAVVDPSGAPAFGAYQGYVPAVTWDGLRGPWRPRALDKIIRRKTWHYAGIFGAETVVAFAIIHVGYAASAFAYIFDRTQKKLLCDFSWTGLPRASTFTASPGEGARSRFASGKNELVVERPFGTEAWHLHGKGPRGFSIEARLDARVTDASGAPSLCAIAQIDRAGGGIANCTHKTLSLPATGSATIDGQRFDLAGGYGGLDHTWGLLSRDTTWRWASASSKDVSFNLVEGFNGPVENVMWVAGQMVPVGAVRFTYDKTDTRRPWTIVAENGSLELTFTPEGERREDKSLIVAKSWYVQPIGTFRGVARLPGGATVSIDQVAGVTEDHVAKW